MDLAIEIAGFLIGILYLWWEYHADSKLWLASLIMPAISMWIYFRKGLYADFGINIYYFIIAIYGYWAWTHGKKKAAGNGSVSISHVPVAVLVASTVVFAAIWGAIYYFLEGFTDSTVPVADAFTTALSIVAMWLLARKYVEQWIAWIVVDAVCVGLYAYKGIYLYAVLYAAYTVVAFFGYGKWIRLMDKQSVSE